MVQESMEKHLTIGALAKFIQENLVGDVQSLLDIFKNAPSNILFIDSSAQVMMCNESTCKTFGCATEEEFVKNFFTLTPPVQPNGRCSQELYQEYTAEAYKKGSATFTWTHLDRRGNELPMQVTLIRLRGAGTGVGQVMVAFLQDLRPLVQLEEKHAQMMQMTKAILDATPLCLNLWNEDRENTMCNKMATELFALHEEKQYLQGFAMLSPQYQPNGEKSGELARAHIDKAFETGYDRFLWLHCDLNGNDIPAEITLVRLDVEDEQGKALVAGYTRDLRGHFAGTDGVEDDFNGYFFNKISDKVLFNTVAEMSDEWFFVLDMRTLEAQYFGKGSERFGLKNRTEKFPQHLVDEGIIYKEDVEIIHQLKKNMKADIYEELDIRFIPFDGIPHYHRISYKTVKNDKGEITFVIGKAIDVHEQRLLEVRSRTDLLTNCYNKVTAETTIADQLLDYKDERHVLFIVDIDNFKAINDNLGHHFGDLVLGEVARDLKNNFRGADIIGRIGGDEFIVFVRQLSNKAIIEQKAKGIASAFQNTYSGENHDYKISGSIGIARYPQDGETYEALYKAADKALYQSKLRGKDCYTFYHKNFLSGTMENRTTLDNANRMANAYFDAELISTAFNLLYETKDIKSSLNAALQYFGRRLNADRCYIFESFDKGKTYNNTYEWCDKDIPPEIDNLQGLEAAVLADFFTLSDKEGILYCNDLKMLQAEGAYDLMADQGIKSFLHAQISEKNYVKLFFGVDDCTRTRVWSEKEINSIQYVTKFISSFLLLDQQIRKTEQA